MILKVAVFFIATLLGSCKSGPSNQDDSSSNLLSSSGFSSKLKTGQIIGISESASDPYTFFFEMATRTRFGHVGMVAQEGNRLFVYNMTPEAGVVKSDLASFLARAGGSVDAPKNVAVVELKTALTATQSKKLLANAETLSKRRPSMPYNSTQDYAVTDLSTAKKLNCSEFIYIIFKDAGVDIGKVVDFSELNSKALGGKLKDTWIKLVNPNAEKSKYISPASLMLDPKVKKITGDLLTSEIKDKDVIEGWHKDGGFPLLALALANVDPSYPSDGDKLYEEFKKLSP